MNETTKKDVYDMRYSPYWIELKSERVLLLQTSGMQWGVKSTDTTLLGCLEAPEVGVIVGHLLLKRGSLLL